VVKGEAPDIVKKAYKTVFEAREYAKTLIRPGAVPADIHNAAKDLMEKRGFQTGRKDEHNYGFFHGLGHSIGQFANLTSGGHRRIQCTLPIHSKHLLHVQVGRRDIGMNYPFLNAFKRFEGSFNQMRAALCQPHDENIIGNVSLFDQTAEKVKIVLTGRRESRFNLFKTDFTQQLEILEFLVRGHWVRQRLVSITQIDRAPDGAFRQCARRPLTGRHVK